MKALLKLLFVDSLVNILGDLFEQPLVMWAFIGLGWLSILVMVTSVAKHSVPFDTQRPFISVALLRLLAWH